MIQILQATKDTTNVTKEVVSAIASGHTELIIEKLITRDEQYAITPESGNQYPNIPQKFS